MDLLQTLLYRNRAEQALEPFQKDDEIGPSDRREPAFEIFVRKLLELLEEKQSVRAIGLRIESRISTVTQEGAASIIVRQKISAVEEGIVRESLDVQTLYAECFPRNAVFDGIFVLNRNDALVKRYQSALELSDAEEELAAIANLCRAAEAAFTPSTIRFLVEN